MGCFWLLAFCLLVFKLHMRAPHAPMGAAAPPPRGGATRALPPPLSSFRVAIHACKTPTDTYMSTPDDPACRECRAPLVGRALPPPPLFAPWLIARRPVPVLTCAALPCHPLLLQ